MLDSKYLKEKPIKKNKNNLLKKLCLFFSQKNKISVFYKIVKNKFYKKFVFDIRLIKSLTLNDP